METQVKVDFRGGYSSLSVISVRMSDHSLVVLGNVHLNVTCKEYDEEVTAVLEPFLYDWTAQNQGSISAEHGLGKYSASFFTDSRCDKQGWE